LLGLTSNKGAEDFQTEGQPPLYQKVISKASQWGSLNNLMFVVGATKAQLLSEIRKVIPEHFLLVPGVGAQGGSLQEVAQHGMNKNCGLIVNASRSIIYASADIDFADKAAQEAKNIQQLMSRLLARCGQ
jgi:orotidine-5'-phosphate decarboxylase